MAKPSIDTMRDAAPSLWRIMRYFSPYIRKESRIIGVGFAALFGEVIMRLLQPWPLKIVLDNVLGGQPLALPGVGTPSSSALLLLAVASVIVVALGRALAAYWSTIGFALAGNRVLTQVRADLFGHMQRLSLGFHTKARSGDLVIRVIGDIGQLRDIVTTAALPLVGNIMIVVGMLSVMFWINRQLALLALITAPLFALSTARLGKRIRYVSRLQRKREGAIAATASESIGAIKIVQALSLQDTFARAFARENKKSLKEGVQGRRLSAQLERTVDVFIAVSTALVLWYGAQLALSGALSVGVLVVFLQYLKDAFKPVRDTAKFAGRLAKAAAAGERVIELLEQRPDIHDAPDARPAPRFQGAVQFEHVTFGYEPNQPILKDLGLCVPAGLRVAIVGPSGNGKSTLVSLLLRLYDPQQGRILVDNADIRQFTLRSLRAQISIVLQENTLFAASVHDNIAYGAPDATDEQIVQAAKLANAHEFIMALPNGYDTIVSERGASLSGGQRQRIAIARAAVRDAPILVLDELTTGLDEENAQLVIDATERLAAGRTTFFITHDLRIATRRLRGVHRRRAGGRAGHARGVDAAERTLRRVVQFANGGAPIQQRPGEDRCCRILTAWWSSATRRYLAWQRRSIPKRW